MDFAWILAELGDVSWIALAFVLGLLARAIGLPPMVGFLVAGFAINAQGMGNHALLQTLSDLGITLLLFTVGLKLSLSTLARPQVWAVAGLHMAITVGLFALLFAGLAALAVPYFAELTLTQVLLVAFALSFSSTVFVVKVLEERSEMTSLHGRIAVGILLMQDIAAVVFLAFSSGKMPSLWALSLLLLIPLKPLLHRLLQGIGHGELLVLYGFLLALGGAQVFELVGVKGDLGALVLGVMVASHPKADEMAKAMLGFKDLFLIGFFLSIGLSGQPSSQSLLIALLLTPLILLKSALFLGALTRFNLRARTALLATINLTNYSEFGLIVVAVGVANGWLDNDWLIVLAMALSLSFVVSARLSARSGWLHQRYRTTWRRLQRGQLIADDQLLDLGGARVAVIGMGGVGTGTYDEMRKRYGETVVGVDVDPVTTRNQLATGRIVVRGDPSDADFWDRVEASHTLELVMLALPMTGKMIEVIDRLQETTFKGHIAAMAKFPDDVEALQAAGVATVFNMYSEAGAGFAAHVARDFTLQSKP